MAKLSSLTPTKIVCVGKNYVDHARELGGEPPAEPLLFLKPPSSLIPDGGTRLEAKDRAVLFSTPEHVREVEQMFRVSMDHF